MTSRPLALGRRDFPSRAVRVISLPTPEPEDAHMSEENLPAEMNAIDFDNARSKG